MNEPPSPRSPRAPRAPRARPAEITSFPPAQPRARHDGWTPARQHDFILALAESGCVTEAAAAVGMVVRNAYRLRARPDANAFRQSWDIALDYAIRNLTDAAYSRALHGVSRPVFYKGEQVGERRYYDERLTQFLLRYRDPTRYGAWLDHYEARRHPDGAAIVLANALNVVLDRAHGVPPPSNDGEDGEDGEDGVESDDNLPERALAEGPPPSTAECDFEEIDGEHPELRELRWRIRAWNNQPIDDEDDGERDWRDPLLTRRPSNRKPAGPRC